MTALYAFDYTPTEVADVDAGVMVAALLDAYETPASLARVLGVSRATIYGWRRRGAIPHADTCDRIAELYAHLTSWEPA